METIKTISVKQFCIHYKVPKSFIETLSEFELIDIIKVKENKHIKEHQINTIEKLIRLHYDLNINFEGLDVISNLINQINELQSEIQKMQNKIDFYTHKF